MAEQSRIQFREKPEPSLNTHVENESSSRNIEYILLIQNLPEGWTQNPLPVRIPASSEGTVSLSLTIPSGRGWDVQLVVTLKGDGDEELTETVPIHIAGTIPAPVPPTPEPTPEPDPEPDTEPVGEPVIVQDPPVRPQPKLEPKPEPSPKPEPAPQSVEPAPAPVTVVPPAPVEPPKPPQPEPVVDTPKPVAPETPKPAPPTPPVAPPPTQPDAPPQETRVTDIPKFGGGAETTQTGRTDHTTSFGKRPETVELQRDRIQDANPGCLIDPEDGYSLTLEPGAEILVAFNFLNNAAKDIQYYVEWDDRELPANWKQAKPLPQGVVAARPEVNVGPKDFNDVGFWIKIPKDAMPFTYRIPVETGVRMGDAKVVTLNVRVEPKPKILVSVPTSTIWKGPFTRKVEAVIDVQNVGNVETAYRLLVVNAVGKQTDMGTEVKRNRGRGSGDGLRHRPASPVPKWTLSLDRELDELPAPTMKGSAPTHSHLLTCEREKLWWFGFQESLKVVIEGTVVNDRREELEGENRHELTISIRRFIPMAWFISAPLATVLAMFLLSASPAPSIRADLESDSHRKFLLATELGETPKIEGVVDVNGSLLSFPTTAATFSIRDNAKQTVESGHTMSKTVDLGPLWARANEINTKEMYRAAVTVMSTSLAKRSGTEDEAIFAPIRTDKNLIADLQVDTAIGHHYSSYVFDPPKGAGLSLDKITSNWKETPKTTDAVEGSICEIFCPAGETGFSISLSNTNPKNTINCWLLSTRGVDKLEGAFAESKPEHMIDAAREVNGKEEPGLLEFHGRVMVPEEPGVSEIAFLTTDKNWRIIVFRFLTKRGDN